MCVTESQSLSGTNPEHNEHVGDGVFFSKFPAVYAQLSNSYMGMSKLIIYTLFKLIIFGCIVLDLVLEINKILHPLCFFEAGFHLQYPD